MFCHHRRALRLVAAPALAVCALFAVLAGDLFADDPKPPQADSPPATAPTAEPPAEAPADPFELPKTTDAASVEQFIGGLVRAFQTRPAEARTEEGSVEFLNRMDGVLARLQAGKLEEESAVLAASVRKQVLEVLKQLEDKTAEARLTAMVKSLQDSEVPALKQLAEQFDVMAQLEKFPLMTPEQRAVPLAQIARHLKEGPINADWVQLAQNAAQMLQDMDQTQEAVKAYEIFARQIEARGDDRLAGLIENFRAAGRFANLPGNAIEVKGTTVDGKPFDIANLKGKVVLVDFWATWCGPCLGELPNVKQNYDLYHSKGFEIVGVSLDDDADRLKEFLAEEKIQWTTLFPEKEEERGWENPIARHYGISGIPTVILVNQEGKVVHLNARGAALGEELAKLLGPAEPASPPAEPASESKSN